MTVVWFKVDDGFAMHSKVVAAGNSACGLWVRAGSWSAQQLTNGLVPKHMIGILGGRPADAQKLVKVGLWHETEDGYRFHQWDQEGRQPSREKIEKDREAWRERQRKSRANRDDGGSDVTPLSRRDSR